MKTTIKTTVHAFRFDISNPEQKAAWLAVKADRKASGVKTWTNNQGASYSDGKAHKFSILMLSLDGMTIELETDFVNDDQWNTAPIEGKSEIGLRVFDYVLDVWPNKDIISGYWLEQTEEMVTLRRDTLKCGYCGKMEHVSEGHKFCTKCLDSAHLQIHELHLLRLLPAGISFGGKRPQLTADELLWLAPLYTEAQLKGNGQRSEAYKAKQRADLLATRDKVIENATTEYDGFTALLDLGLSIENVIYYNHTKRFSFGWRAPLDVLVVDAVLAVISEFPFPYEIKCADGRTLTGN
jgi:hypothetical protein